jgi:hypothetical protein
LDRSVIPVNMTPYQSNVNAKQRRSSPAHPTKGAPMFDQIAAALAVAALFIAPIVILAITALRYGVDSRPGIGDRDQRPWLVPSK